MAPLHFNGLRSATGLLFYGTIALAGHEVTAPLGAQQFQAYFEPLEAGAYAFCSSQVTAQLNAGRAELVFPAEGASRSSLTFRFVHANKITRAQGADLLVGTTSYFPGPDSSRWRTGVPHFGSVVVPEAYPGIDVKYYITEGREFEYDFVVKPGADPRAIAISVEGARSISVTRDGILHIKIPGGNVSQKLTVYQEIGGKRKEVAARFKVRNRQVRFDVDDYDRERPLIIDPVVFGKTSYIVFGSIGGLAVDSSGNYYVTGNSHQSSLGFAPGFQTSQNPAENNVFVAKYDPARGTLLYATFLGTGSALISTGIAVNGAGEAHVTGVSCGNLPVANAFQSVYGGNCDAFLTKLNSAGTALIYSTYLGGSGEDYARSISLGSDSSAYIAGYTRSANFPLLNPAQSAYAGGVSDGFVAKVDPAGTLQYSTYLGGTQKDDALAITTDAQGSAYLTGATTSPDFPTRGPQLKSFVGGGDNAFVTKLAPGGGTLTYSTFLDSGTGTGIGVDSSLNMYVAAWNIRKISPDGSTLLPFSASGQGPVEELTVTPAGHVYAVGFGQRYISELQYFVDYRYVSHSDSNGQFLSSSDSARSIPPFDPPPTRQTIAHDPNGNVFIAGVTAVNASVGDGTIWVAPVQCATISSPPLPAAGGQFPMNVLADAGCSWTVTTLSDWLTIIGVASGSGNGTVLVQVEPNRGAARKGALSIGPVEIPQTQDAASSTFIPNALTPQYNTSGTGESFTVIVNPPSSSIAIINLLFNNFLDGRYACYMAYVASANVLYLVNDAGTGLLPGISTGGTTANSQCTVTFNGYTVQGVLGVFQANIQFNQANFAKDLVAYGAVRGPGDVTNTGWKVLGAYHVTPLTIRSPAPVSTNRYGGNGIPTGGLAGPFYPFQAQFQDSGGAASIKNVQVLIAPALTAIGACYFGYDHTNNALYLVGDNGSTLLGPLRPGGPVMGPMENSQCVAIGLGTYVVESGNTLTLVINLAFKRPPAGDDGTRIIYLGAQNASGSNSDWHALGWITLQNQ